MSLETHELVTEMEKALAQEYLARKDKTLPEMGKEDRELLFTAIARGILQYLESKEDEFISTIRLKRGDAERNYTVTDLNLDIDP